MNTESLKEKFFISAETINIRLEALVGKIRPYCGVDAKGDVHFESCPQLTLRDRIFFALSARFIGSKLDEKIADSATVKDLHQWLGVPENQIRARCNDLIKDAWIIGPERGIYRAVPIKIERYADSLIKEAPKN